MSAFNNWLDTFLSEKKIDGEEVIIVAGKSGENYVPVACLVDMMKIAPAHEQRQIKNVLVQIDFRNGDVRDFLKHLAKAIAL